jgi:hypothetical protein
MKSKDQKYSEAVERNLEYAKSHSQRFDDMEDARYRVGVRANDSKFDNELKPLIKSKSEE